MLEDDAQVMSDASLDEQLEGQPPEIQDEVLRINDEARPQALQIALVIPLLVSICGLFWGIPDDAASRSRAQPTRRRGRRSLADSSPLPGDAPSGVDAKRCGCNAVEARGVRDV